MQLSENTIDVLKNFSAINPGLFAKQGNTLRTVSKSKTVLSKAVIDETIPKDFGIHELPQLLSIFSIYKTPPEIEVSGNDLVIRGLDGRSKITYRTCDETMVRVPPAKDPTLPSEDVKFSITEDDLSWILKTSSVLASPNISVIARDGKLYVGTMDSADDSAHTNSLEIGDYNGDPAFFVFKTENWILLPGAYDITISNKGIAHFVNTARKVEYWIALEARKP